MCTVSPQLGDKILNPCGMVANPFFNDVTKLLGGVDQNNKTLEICKDRIKWRSDMEYLFKQLDGFHYKQLESCKECSCDVDEWSFQKPWIDDNGLCYRYFYPDDDTTQYLYELRTVNSSMRVCTFLYSIEVLIVTYFLFQCTSHLPCLFLFRCTQISSAFL